MDTASQLTNTTPTDNIYHPTDTAYSLTGTEQLIMSACPGAEPSLKLFHKAQKEHTTLAKYQLERHIGHFPLPLQAAPDSKETEPCPRCGLKVLTVEWTGRSGFSLCS